MPKVSVVITTYNRMRYLSQAINSVLDQGYRDFEVIVVDDGSTDNTGGILQQYAGKICYMRQQHAGRAEARNTGIKNAQGDYIAFLDDDDLWLPDKLEKQVSFLDTHTDTGLVHSFTELIDENGYLLCRETKRRLRLYHKAMEIGYTYVGMSRACVMFISSVMARKDCFDKIGLFDPRTETYEDWDLYLRIAMRYKIGTIPLVLVQYRLHQGRSTNEGFFRGRIQTALKHLGLIDHSSEPVLQRRLRRNFYVHLAYAYYIGAEFKESYRYAREAIRLDPLLVFDFYLVAHLLIALLPEKAMGLFRSPKTFLKNYSYK